MFVYSFKASSLKLWGIICVCVVAAALVISLMPGVGSSLNVNKLEGMKELSKINVSKVSGRIEFLERLGFSVDKDSVTETSERLPEKMDAVTEKYNALQRMQGLDLSGYCGKKLKGYTYEVVSLPDNTKTGGNRYLATVIVYKNKVVGADLCCKETGEVLPLITAI